MKFIYYYCSLTQYLGFPGRAVVKNLPANAGDPGSIPGLGRSPGEGHGNPLQYCCLENPMDRGAWWARAQGFPGGLVVKNPPAMQEMQIPSLGQEDPPEKGMATHSSILAWRIPWTEEPGRLQSMGSQRVRQD